MRSTMIVALALTLAFPAAAAARTTDSSAAQVTSLRRGISWQRSTTWRLQDRAGVARTPTRHVERRTSSVPFLRWISKLWLGRRIAARRLRPAIAHEPLWLCIHTGYLHGVRVSVGEGTWGDQGAPYYGGLQMSLGWDGLVGDAGDLSPRAQMRAAETGYARAGYGNLAWLRGQWPNTAPPCLSLA